jgi:hypothetical protein
LPDVSPATSPKAETVVATVPQASATMVSLPPLGISDRRPGIANHENGDEGLPMFCPTGQRPGTLPRPSKAQGASH